MFVGVVVFIGVVVGVVGGVSVLGGVVGFADAVDVVVVVPSVIPDGNISLKKMQCILQSIRIMAI